MKKNIVICKASLASYWRQQPVVTLPLGLTEIMKP